jgi:DMSO/TMAO reductase YedYZ molybdopterin-dependent catalytic subunit
MGMPFYSALPLRDVADSQTILAYAMNGRPLALAHGAPCRLRAETQLGYKMTKFLKSIELVYDISRIGLGQGGHREDFRYYGFYAGI